jgi:molecular chaperone DnaK (HSP70)
MSTKAFKLASLSALPIFVNTKLGKKVLDQNQVSECSDMKHHMQEEAANLDKIFTEDGAMMDPHEVMEMMMNKRGNSLKPFPFEKIMQNC